MPTFIDQLGNTISLQGIPKRIVSLVPSQTELLWDLGLQTELVGVTKFCVHPNEMFRSINKVGGTKSLDLNKIRNLKPDLIIGNKEENEKSQIEELQKEFNVWMSDIYNFEDALQMMSGIGEVTGKNEKANKIIVEIKKLLPSIKNIFKQKRVVYFIWNKPYMPAAENTYIHYVLTYIGLLNAASHLQRYPVVTIDELIHMKPELCLLSSEPYPFKEKHCREIEEFIPGTKALIVDGEMFSWYGSRICKLPEYLKQIEKNFL